MIAARLALAALDPAAELAAFLAAIDDGQGAVASFVGLTRGSGGVEALFLDHHPQLSETSLLGIARDAAERFELGAVRVVHRAGSVAAGEPIVWVAAAAPHRRAAFDGVDYAMDRLKTDAILWKREDGGGGSRWIEPTAADQAARQCWEG